MKHRPEIDGIRAVAVIPVVLFHAGISGLSGGFVGVDVFFVISGFLITSIIHDEMIQEAFSFARFYERRVRRILPNLLVMVFATCIAAAVLLIPTDLKQFGASAIAAVACMANIYFWSKVGYFAPNSGQLPLLHTWSLGVEEQYYLAFPPMLALALRRWPGRTAAIVWLLFCASFAFSVVQVRLSADAAFYLPFARLWELMLGSLVAIRATPTLRRPIVCEAAAIVGLALIGLAILTFNQRTLFPGEAALVPCVGTALLIQANSQRSTWVGRMLSLKPLTFIGAISYSLYLWHWPILVLTRYALQRELTAPELAVVLVGILAVSISAWWWVERPMRLTRHWARAKLFIGAGVASGALVALPALFWLGGGLPQRLPPLSRAYAAGSLDVNPMRERCDSASLARLETGQVCRLGAPNTAPSFALIGDSFGDALAPGVARAASDLGVSGLFLTRGGCIPLVGVGERRDACRHAENAAYRLVAESSSIRSVILIARWPGFVDGSRFGLFAYDGIFSTDDMSREKSHAENVRVVERALARSIGVLSGRRVFVVTGLPEQQVDVPQAASLRTRFGGDMGGLDKKVLDSRQALTRTLMARLSPRLGFTVLDAEARLCSDRRCPLVEGDHALYADDNHLSRYGAARLRSLFYPALAITPAPAAAPSQRRPTPQLPQR